MKRSKIKTIKQIKNKNKIKKNRVTLKGGGKYHREQTILRDEFRELFTSEYKDLKHAIDSGNKDRIEEHVRKFCVMLKENHEGLDTLIPVNKEKIPVRKGLATSFVSLLIPVFHILLDHLLREDVLKAFLDRGLGGNIDLVSSHNPRSVLADAIEKKEKGDPLVLLLYKYGATNKTLSNHKKLALAKILKDAEKNKDSEKKPLSLENTPVPKKYKSKDKSKKKAKSIEKIHEKLEETERGMMSLENRPVTNKNNLDQQLRESAERDMMARENKRIPVAKKTSKILVNRHPGSYRGPRDKSKKSKMTPRNSRLPFKPITPRNSRLPITTRNSRLPKGAAEEPNGYTEEPKEPKEELELKESNKSNKINNLTKESNKANHLNNVKNKEPSLARLLIPDDLTDESPPDYDPEVEPEFWKPLFAKNEMSDLKARLQYMMAEDCTQLNQSGKWSLCNFNKSIISSYFIPKEPKLVMVGPYKSIPVRDSPMDFTRFNVILCAALIIFGVITQKMKDEDYFLVLKGGKAIQIALSKTNYKIEYESEDIDALILPKSDFDLKKVKFVASQISYLVKWFLHSMDPAGSFPISVQIPEMSYGNKFIYKLSYLKETKRFNAFSDIDFKEVPDDLKQFYNWKELDTDKGYIFPLRQQLLFYFPKIENLYDEKMYTYDKYNRFLQKLNAGKKITDEGYETITKEDCLRFMEKFEKAIKVLSKALKR